MDVKEKIKRLLLYAAFPIVAFYLMEAYEHNPFTEVRTEAQFFNILLFELIAWVLFFLLGRMHIAIRIELVLAMVFGLVNHYVMAFRSTPFVPWDIFSAGTAMSVAEGYDFTPGWRVVLVTLGFLVLGILAQYLKKAPRGNWKIRLGGAAVSVLALCLFVGMLQQEEFQTEHYLYPFLFTPAYMTKVNGMAVTFAMDLAYVAVDKPQGYSAAEAEEILASYDKTTETTAAEADTEELPNVIVIMDEAFSDLAVLGDVGADTDYMPFLHSLWQGAPNTITGYAQTSVCGGNTADSEFEFLTGDTMAFLPTGSIPYQQYIKEETPSLASYLASLGYATYAQHPYQAAGWDRERVYPLLGFENLSFLPDYTNASYVRKYVSDASDMQYLIDTFEQKEPGKPAFIFNVTMQNHGGYTDSYPTLESGVTTSHDSPVLSQYLSLMKLTDQALEDLIDYFSQVDEKTVIVFFGDHQPSSTVARVITGTTDSEDVARYQVPYLVWANYEIEGQTDRDTSLNYLAAQVLTAAGVPTNAYQNFLLELSETYPVFSAAGQVTASGQAADDDVLLTYQKLQYYNLFETK
jgi:phosphoglycerol transferase MdoB-like AlkP superfamily enzyme